MPILKKVGLYVFILTVGVFVFSLNSQANQNATRLRIDQKTIIKGYTVAHDNNNIRFAVTPNQVDQEVYVVLKNRGLEDNPLPENKKVVSQIYSFDMIGKEYNPIITKRPSWIALRYNSSDNTEKAIYYWDSNRNNWIKLPSSVDTENKYVRAITHLPYSKVAVLEEAKSQKAYTGTASWYHSGQSMTAAMKQFNIGDKVKVTNLANNKSCLVTIIDRGPFVFGWIIDLSEDAFASLAPLSEGLIKVKVEKIN